LYTHNATHYLRIWHHDTGTAATHEIFVRPDALLVVASRAEHTRRFGFAAANLLALRASDEHLLGALSLMSTLNTHLLAAVGVESDATARALFVIPWLHMDPASAAWIHRIDLFPVLLEGISIVTVLQN
jgi:hypothetical protein